MGPKTKPKNIADRWVPVGERLPDEGVEVLVLPPHGSRFIGCRYTTKHWSRQDGGEGPALDGTYWMPIPAGPEVQP